MTFFKIKQNFLFTSVIAINLIPSGCLAKCESLQPTEALKRLDEFKVANKDLPGIHHKIDRWKFHYLRQLPGFKATVPCSPIQVPSQCAVPLEGKKHKNCDGSIIITECDFRDKGRNGIIIDKPGKYRLGETITFRPTKQNVQAITITASNVVLDLDVYTLQQDLQKPQTGVYGIAIARDVHNVKITGSRDIAQIRDFTLAGIRVLGRTDAITLENVTVTQTIAPVLTNDLLPADCADIGCALITGGIYVGEGEPTGLAFFGTDKNNHVTNLVLNHVNAKRCIFGSQIVMTFGVQIDDSSFVENTSNGLILGFFLPIPGDLPNTFEFPVGSDGTVRNCHFDRTVGDNINLVNPTAIVGFFQTVSGIAIDEVQNYVFENCTADDNFNSGTVFSVDHDGAHNITWRNCTFSRNISTSANCDGFHFSGSIPEGAGVCVGIGDQPFNQDLDVVVENCNSLNNQGGTEGVDGFIFYFTVGARISDCNSSGNFSTNSNGFSSSGFNVYGATPGGQSANITFLRCTAERNGNDGFQTSAIGFLTRSATSNVIYRDCIANGNAQQQEIRTLAAGFAINAVATAPENGLEITQNITYDHCIANGNGSPDQSAMPNGGIVIRRSNLSLPPIVNVLIQDCTLAYNQNGLFVNNDISGLVVKRNEADQNSLVGFNVSAVTTKLVTENIAYNNLGGNYAGVPNAIIVPATTTALPTAIGALNLDIVP